MRAGGRRAGAKAGATTDPLEDGAEPEQRRPPPIGGPVSPGRVGGAATGPSILGGVIEWGPPVALCVEMASKRGPATVTSGVARKFKVDRLRGASGHGGTSTLVIGPTPSYVTPSSQRAHERRGQTPLAWYRLSRSAGEAPLCAGPLGEQHEVLRLHGRDVSFAQMPRGVSHSFSSLSTFRMPLHGAARLCTEGSQAEARPVDLLGDHESSF